MSNRYIGIVRPNHPDRLLRSVAGGLALVESLSRYDFALRSKERSRDSPLKLFALTMARPRWRHMAEQAKYQDSFEPNG